MDLEHLASYRRPYDAEPFDEADAAAEPVEQFAKWLDVAARSEPEPHAMVLATAGSDGQPRSRNVLLRGIDDDGALRFFTNRRSLKGIHLEQNPLASVTFSWLGIHRQVHACGSVEPLSDADSDAYWRTRPRSSQIASAVSPQSEVVAGRAELEGLWAAFEAEVGDGEVTRPAHWGGERLVPVEWEFWQGRADRRHDRIAYRLAAGAWTRVRLAP